MRSASPIGEKLLRTAAVYIFLLLELRLAGKRELGQLNPFDLVVVLLLSNTLQNAIIGNGNSRELMTRGELESAARRQGIEDLHQVETCLLEIGGALTFVPKLPTGDEMRHRELLARLDALGRAQATLLERVATIDQG